MGAITEQQTSTFQFQPQSADCSCPIHRNRDREPFTAPLGLSFADDVSASPITAEAAAGIYDAHHAYISTLPAVNIDHHGLYFQGQLVGAITYRKPLGTRKLFFDDDDQLLARPRSELDIESLPAGLRPTARSIVPSVEETAVTSTDVVGGRSIVEVARICIGVDMPKLASAALAASQEHFVQSDACSDDTDYLLTFVRADYQASMVRALRDKGWTCTGWSEPSQATNRPDTQIRDRYKWRFLCPVDHIHTQAGLSEWTDAG